MAKPKPDDWPHLPDGTTDWGRVFEGKRNGFIGVVTQAHTPVLLKQCAALVIHGLFQHEHDEAKEQKYAAELNRIVPDDAPNDEIEGLRKKVVDLFHHMEEELRHMAAVETQRRLHPPGPYVSPVQDKKSSNLPTIVALSLVLIGLIGFALFRPTTGDMSNQEAVQIGHYAERHFPGANWHLASASVTDGTIKLEIKLTDQETIDVFNRVSSIQRASFLKDACPPMGPELQAVLDKGFTLWMDLKGGGKLLTGGSCTY
ncbi:MAG: hypothetical protein HOI33_08275 [Rhodospirillaceae bacterium]|jgi:hypothetical protein|nr:hypothetical protein [Rhodospirillaceae bacterium]MBT5659931.1 hypothetical protein [Rhodospirillaceae bacterium]MBT5752690.1 hypothetical protein [Rhodospirillaceae bacterium]